MGVYFGGVPTEIEVSRLRMAYPLPAAGQKITYAELEKVTGCAKTTCRFRTVLNAWRVKLRRDSIYLKAVVSTGFTVCTDPEKVDLSASKLHGAVKRIRRSGEVALAADDAGLTKEMQVRKAWLLRSAAVLGADVASLRHTLVADLKRTATLPRPQ